MQRILVPTDFSPVADNALNYALDLATQFKSELYLYHIFSFNKKADYNWDYPVDEQPYVKKLERKMSYTLSKFKEKIAANDITVHTIVEENNRFALFDSITTKHRIDLIVMGSKGASGIKKAIFGSVAATALELAKVPVLVIPPTHSSGSIERIVLTTDLNKISASILSPLEKLAIQFDAQVTVLHIQSASGTEIPQDNYIHLDKVAITYRQIPLSNSINESISGFIQRNKPDILCMIRREKSFFESFYKKSVTTNQVYDNQVPLLVLPEKRINADLSAG